LDVLPSPFVASGELGQAQLAALTKLLEEKSVRDRFIILLVHHPVINPVGRLAVQLRGLVDADRLIELVGTRPALVAHGHLHRRMHRRLGPLQVMGATSASLDHPSPYRMAGYNVYEIDDRLRRAFARVLDPAGKLFREQAIPSEPLPSKSIACRGDS
jgi:hypothetical protein